ncbi:hypothetical protein Tco_0738208, partial [Tanacetum coccineum]
ENKEINEAFPFETLGSVALQDQSDKTFSKLATVDLPCGEIRYHAGKFVTIRGNSLSRE